MGRGGKLARQLLTEGEKKMPDVVSAHGDGQGFLFVWSLWTAAGRLVPTGEDTPRPGQEGGRRETRPLVLNSGPGEAVSVPLEDPPKHPGHHS